MHLLPELQPYEAQTGAKFYPLGVIDGGHAHLFIDEAGRVYMYYSVLKLIATTFPAALEILLLGKPRARDDGHEK